MVKDSRFLAVVALTEVLPGLPGLAAFLAALPKTTASTCPGCQTGAHPVIARFADRSYFRCQNCGLEYLQSFRIDSTQYDESYFFSEYQKQYGKTYLEDFDHIKFMGSSRLRTLGHCGLNLPGKRLLDIGCAYGPFLAAAREAGMLAHGTDISPAAVAHVCEVLALPAVAGDIRHLSLAELGGPFEVVTLWYVIEHFADLHRVLERISQLLVPGAWLALATPSGEGISARRDRLLFLERSPADHFTIWKPSHLKKLLGLFDLELVRIRVTGHHPERFPGPLGWTVFKPLILLVSQIFGLGDTFELYARKRPAGEKVT